MTNIHKPTVRRVAAGLGQNALYVHSTPPRLSRSTRTTLTRDLSRDTSGGRNEEQSKQEHWVVKGVDVTLAPGDQILEPFEQSLRPETFTSITIIVDTLRIEGTHHWPGVPVTIHARNLVFADNGQLNTSALARTAPVTEIDADGMMGRFSGAVELFVGELKLEGAEGTKHIITDGTDGTSPGPGQPGADGPKVIGINPDGTEGTLVKDAISSPALWHRVRDILENTSRPIIGVRVAELADEDKLIPDPWPDLNGEAAKSSGTPGQGTLAGYVNATKQASDLLNTSGALSMKPGKNGTPAVTKGGKPGSAYAYDDEKMSKPVSAFFVIVPWFDWKSELRNNPMPMPKEQLAPARNGEDDPGLSARALPKAFEGAMPANEKLSRWFHPLHAEIFGDFLTDLSRGGHYDQLAEELSDMRETLAPICDAYRAVLPPLALEDFGGGNASAGDAFKTKFAALSAEPHLLEMDQDAYAPLFQLSQQIAGFQNALDRGLDHFGNPAGWAPNFSFAAAMALESGAVKRAIRTLFVAQWLHAAEDQAEALIAAHTQAIEEIRAHREAAMDRQARIALTLPDLEKNSTEVKNALKMLKDRLDPVVDELKEDAKRRAIWASVVDIVGSLLTIIPYGQPALGMVGEAVQTSTDYIKGKDPSAENILGDILEQGKTIGEKALASRASTFQSKADALEDDATSKEEEKYWDKYKSKEHRDFDALKAADAEALRASAKAPKARASQWTAVSENFGDAAQHIFDDVKVLAAPEDAAKAILKKLEEADPSFQEFTKEIEAFNKRKAEVIVEILKVHTECAFLAHEIAESHRLEGVMFEALFDASQGRLSASVMGAADRMRARALEYLIEQRYNLIRGYEALFLEPYPAESDTDPFGIEPLIAQFSKAAKDLVGSGDGGSAEETREAAFRALETTMEEFNVSIARSLADRLAASSADSLLPKPAAAPIMVEMTPDQLAVLNEDAPSAFGDAADDYPSGVAQPNTISLNIGQVPLFLMGHDKVMIRDIEVADIAVSQKPGHEENAGYRTAELLVHHNGTGLVKHQNALYSVRFGTRETDGAHSAGSWQIAYQESDQSVTYSRQDPSAEGQNTLLALLDRLTDGGARIDAGAFVKALPAWTELSISGGYQNRWANIEKLVLRIHVDSVEAGRSTNGIDLRMANGAEWPVDVTVGQGPTRTYSTPALILGESDAPIVLRPEQFELRKIEKIDGHEGEDGVWNTRLRDGELFHLKMEDVARKLPAPTEPMEWTDFALNLNNALRRGLIGRNERVWNPRRALAYTYTYVDAAGVETPHAPWLRVDHVKYFGLKLRLPLLPDGQPIKDVKLYRRVNADARGKHWGSIEEIVAFEDPGQTMHLVPLPSPLAAEQDHDGYEFFDINM